MMKRLILCAWIIALLIPAAIGLAQPGVDDVEGLVDAAVAALGQQLDVGLGRQDLSRWRWEETYFTDSALNCPLPDETYTSAYTRGYIVLLDYADLRYEFHLSPDGTAVHFCGAEVFKLPTPTPSPTPVDATLDAAEASPVNLLTDRQRAFDVILDYVNEQTRLGLTRSRLTMWSFQTTLWEDESLDCPQPNRNYDGYLHPVPGYNFTFVFGSTEYEIHMTWDGSRIMPCGDTQLLPYVDRTRDPLSLPTATPAPTATLAAAG
jgi:hypothetical protein